MSTENFFIMKKNVDQSLLNDGFTIPLPFHSFIDSAIGKKLEIGEKISIKIWIGAQIYEARLVNQPFDRNKFNHVEIYQIRYSSGSPIAKYFREVFSESTAYIEEQKMIPENYRKQLKIPETINEYLVLNSSTEENTFSIDCFTNHDSTVLRKDINQINETVFENVSDTSATIKYLPGLKKIRMLNSNILKSLKKLYDSRCQVTGEKIGAEYGDCVIEAHHIDYFTKSLNNDPTNIIIVSPNFHRIIHKNNPEFIREKLEFRFPNGYVEKIKLDKHLNV